MSIYINVRQIDTIKDCAKIPNPNINYYTAGVLHLVSKDGFYINDKKGCHWISEEDIEKNADSICVDKVAYYNPHLVIEIGGKTYKKFFDTEGLLDHFFHSLRMGHIEWFPIVD